MLLPMNRKLVLDDLPKLRIEDGLVLAWVGCALVNDFSPIGPVLQQEFGRRFVDDYSTPISVVDLLLNSPFDSERA
jgi:hypothetical protein